MNGLHYIVAKAAWKQLQFSCMDANQAFQHTNSTRLKPDVINLKKELTGEDEDHNYYLTTFFKAYQRRVGDGITSSWVYF